MTYVDAPKWASADSEPESVAVWSCTVVLSVRSLDLALVGRGPVWCS